MDDNKRYIIKVKTNPNFSFNDGYVNSIVYGNDPSDPSISDYPYLSFSRQRHPDNTACGLKEVRRHVNKILTRKQYEGFARIIQIKLVEV